MIKNYFKTALRSLWKNKATSFINLFGLSVGMTAAVFIFLWVQNELTVDSYHSDQENIYRITNSLQINKEEAWVWESSPMQMAEVAGSEIPAVKQFARLIVNAWGGPVFTVNKQLFTEKTTAYVEKNWFSLFDYNFVAGNATAFEQQPFSIILTESKAKKYFGTTKAVGQLIRVDSVPYTVQGIIKDNPTNSSFQFDVLMQMDGRLSNPETAKNDRSWNNFNYLTFLQLRPDAKIAGIEKKLNDILDKTSPENSATASLQPLSGMYFQSNLQTSDLPHGDKKATYIFVLLGLLLLITACINYVNLTTAKAGLRAKEISVRKIIGARKAQLFLQFVAESFTISLFSLLVTLVLIQLCLPLFNAITEKHFELSLTTATVWQVLLGTLLFATLLNGIYPASLLASFKPLSVFRGKTLSMFNDGAIRKGLVVFQFSLSIILVIGTIVIYRQLDYIQSSNPGYNISQVMSVQVPYRNYAGLDQDQKKSLFAGIRQQLSSQSSIAAVSNGSNEIVNVTSASSGNAHWYGRDTNYNPSIAHLRVDADFKNLFQLEIKAGNWFKDGKDQHNYILNETAAAQFNIQKPVVGQRFIWGGDTGQVIGVVKDFHYKSLHEKIGPMVISNGEGASSHFFIKTIAGNSKKGVDAASTVFTRYIPGEPFSYTFLDESFNKLYEADMNTSTLVTVFSIIAVIIAALGLFGLAAFTAEQRTKEIGIRKILGASVHQITSLLSKDFVKLVAVAIIIASPVAWWVMNKWLQDFAYRVSINAWIFFAAGFFALIIALLSVAIQSLKAAMANPVKSLRAE